MFTASLSALSKARCTRRGFTLIELLVVIVILASLVGLGSFAVVRTLRSAEETKRSAFAKTLNSAIMAYKTEHGEYPLTVSTSSASYTAGEVSSNASKTGNAEIFMLLLGRDSSGKRDSSKRAYLTDSSFLYIYQNKRVSKLDEVLAKGGVSASDVIGFPIVMNQTKAATWKSLSGAKAFAPVKITFNFELDQYTVTVPNTGNFHQVIKLR
ncbi:MAG: type II secretion system protein [Candidatus Spyradenecus sp.]